MLDTHTGGQASGAPPLLRWSLVPRTPAHLAVFRVRGDLLAVILGAPAALAVRAAAHQLPRLVFRWQEGVLAKATSPFAHTGGCRIRRLPIVRRVLETPVKCVLRPGRWRSRWATKPPEMLSFYPAINTGGWTRVFGRRAQIPAGRQKPAGSGYLSRSAEHGSEPLRCVQKGRITGPSSHRRRAASAR